MMYPIRDVEFEVQFGLLYTLSLVLSLLFHTGAASAGRYFCKPIFFSCFLSPRLVHSALLKENRHYDVSPAKHSKKSHETERQSKRKKRQRKRESEVKIV